MRFVVVPALIAVGLLAQACVDDQFDDGQFLCSPSGGADECPPDMSCGSDGRCRGASSCTPKTCDDLAPLCGERDDGCGHTIDCNNSCWPPQSCGGGGEIGKCGCLPKQEIEHAANAFWNDATIGSVAWSNPDGAQANDDTFATADLGASATSNYLKAADFGFNLPSTAVVEGIQVAIDRVASSDGAIADHEVRVALDGKLLPKVAKIADPWPSTEASVKYGVTGELWDATTTVTPALVNKANFGVALAVDATAAASASVDSIRLRVFVANPSCP